MLLRLGQPLEQRTGIRLEVLPRLRSGGGIKAVADGVLDIVIAGRPLNETERGLGLTEILTLRTPFVFATSFADPPGMTEQQVVAVYADAAARWPNGAHIKLILRPRSEEDNTIMIAHFPGMADALAKARDRPELPIARYDQVNAEFAETISGSFIGATLSQMITEKRALRMIAIGGVAPDIATFENGRYRYGKLFRVMIRQQSTPNVDTFLRFITSEEGTQLLRDAGCLPGNG